MIPPRRGFFPVPPSHLALAISLLVPMLLLGGCMLWQKPAPDPLATYRPALGKGFVATPEQLSAMAQYSLTVQVNPTERMYTGTVQIQVPFTGTTPLTELYFRLYPNLPQFKGQLQVTSASIDGKTVNYAFAASGTAVHLVLPKALPPGPPVTVRMSYTGQVPQHGDDVYTLVGKSQEILSLGTFYPILAAQRRDGPALDVADAQGDAGFHEAALYEVDITAPADQVIVASGTLVSQRPAAGGGTTSHYVQGPAREFTALLSPNYKVLEDDAYGTRVRSYYLADDAEAAKSALYDAVASLQIYSDQFGPYPYRDMAVVEAPLTFRGQEYPGMSLIGSETYREYEQDLEKLVSHEVAHQWWYNQVGSDQTRTPWLDEGLAEFSMYVYYAARHGAEEADLLRARRWEAPVVSARQNGTDTAIGKPVDAYKQNNYESMVYAKGALFFANMRDELGPDPFREVLRSYLDQKRWGIATGPELESIAEKATGKQFGSMFGSWIEGVTG